MSGLDAGAELLTVTAAREEAETAVGRRTEELVDALGDEDATAAALTALEAAELAVSRARTLERAWARRARLERPLSEEEPDPRGTVPMRAIGALSDPNRARVIVAPGQVFECPAEKAVAYAGAGLAELVLARGAPPPAWWPASQPSSPRATA